MQHTGIRALTGLATVAVIAAIVAVAVGLFQGSFTESVPVTVLSPRAGLVMNVDAKVKMRGVQVGKVDSIDSQPNGQAVLHLAMYPSEMHLIPSNVLVDITAPTVFGAKFVELLPPAEPSARSLHAGQVLEHPSCGAIARGLSRDDDERFRRQWACVRPQAEMTSSAASSTVRPWSASLARTTAPEAAWDWLRTSAPTAVLRTT